MESKPSDLMFLVICTWFAKRELLAHRLSNLRGAVEGSKKWMYNFTSVNTDNSPVLQHDGLCRNVLLDVVEGEHDRNMLELRILESTQAILASYYMRKM